ncbi:MAG: thioesterase domain-containing protein [Lentisphaerales bacterium]|nr:thioesterase domain-containing protein [Lentisphaerales bacterium]
MEIISKVQKALYKHIPLAKHLGIQIEKFTGNDFSILAPLEPNINDKGTAFGGSLYSIAVLCGWGFLQLKCSEAKLRVETVIHKAQVKYILPVEGEFTAKTSLDESEWRHWLSVLKKGQRVRIPLNVDVFCDGEKVLSFIGKYVIKPA